MTLKEYSELGRADDDWSLETEALQIAGFEKGTEAYGADGGSSADTPVDDSTADG